MPPIFSGVSSSGFCRRAHMPIPESILSISQKIESAGVLASVFSFLAQYLLM
jgi:hypothetical protein